MRCGTERIKGFQPQRKPGITGDGPTISLGSLKIRTEIPRMPTVRSSRAIFVFSFFRVKSYNLFRHYHYPSPMKSQYLSRPVFAQHVLFSLECSRLPSFHKSCVLQSLFSKVHPGE